jgi:hypothetical protein
MGTPPSESLPTVAYEAGTNVSVGPDEFRLLTDTAARPRSIDAYRIEANPKSRVVARSELPQLTGLQQRDNQRGSANCRRWERGSSTMPRLVSP